VVGWATPSLCGLGLFFVCLFCVVFGGGSCGFFGWVGGVVGGGGGGGGG